MRSRGAVRWHYSPGFNGHWSAIRLADCQTGFVSIGPMATEGSLKLSPGSTLRTGYSFALPGNKVGRTAIVTDANVVFQLRCASGAPASPSTMTVTFPTRTLCAHSRRVGPVR